MYWATAHMKRIDDADFGGVRTNTIKYFMELELCCKMETKNDYLFIGYVHVDMKYQ